MLCQDLRPRRLHWAKWTLERMYLARLIPGQEGLIRHGTVFPTHPTGYLLTSRHDSSFQGRKLTFWALSPTLKANCSPLQCLLWINTTIKSVKTVRIIFLPRIQPDLNFGPIRSRLLRGDGYYPIHSQSESLLRFIGSSAPASGLRIISSPLRTQPLDWQDVSQVIPLESSSTGK